MISLALQRSVAMPIHSKMRTACGPPAEGTGSAPNGGYGTLVYGTIASANNDFSDLVGDVNSPTSPVTIDNPAAVKGNPRIYVQVHPGDPPSQWSSAFGRYQITNKTATAVGFTDFSPAARRIINVPLTRGMICLQIL